MQPRAPWQVWTSERATHVVARIDVSPMTTDEPAPWHTLGVDGYCACQPKVIHVDPVTLRRVIGHQDPIH